MRIRHKVPSIFSLSMVDVLCCSLGCVILLWLLNARQNDEETEEHRRQTAALLAEAQSDREKNLSTANSEAERSAARLADLEKDLRTGTTRLEEERKRAGSLESKLLGTEKLLAEMRGDLDRARARYRSEELRANGLQKAIDERQRELGAVNRSLDDARAARSKLEKTLLNRDKELKERQAAMAIATRTLEKLEKEKLHLRTTAENRFAGIALTGRRVIFLVDMSGSMELVDEETPAPHKWVEVRNTVARLMRSLPALEKYQVITFSSKAEFPLGSAQKWLDHDPKSSPEKVLKTLAAIKPRGGTNMYAALEAAFRYRADGLDTVYLLSDGLPNLGEGLTRAQARALSEIHRGAILGKYVRAMLKTGWNKRRSTQPRVRINTIGFFYESPDLGAFLWALARENDGSFVGMSKP